MLDQRNLKPTTPVNFDLELVCLYWERINTDNPVGCTDALQPLGTVQYIHPTPVITPMMPAWRPSSNTCFWKHFSICCIDLFHNGFSPNHGFKFWRARAGGQNLKNGDFSSQGSIANSYISAAPKICPPQKAKYEPQCFVKDGCPRLRKKMCLKKLMELEYRCSHLVGHLCFSVCTS